VVTTEYIFKNLVKELRALGPIKESLTFVVVTSVTVAIPQDLRAYIVMLKVKTMHELAVERLLEVMKGQRETVFEELDCEIIPPHQAPAD
jgi:hypothetical protein